MYSSCSQQLENLGWIYLVLKKGKWAEKRVLKTKRMRKVDETTMNPPIWNPLQFSMSLTVSTSFSFAALECCWIGAPPKCIPNVLEPS